MFGESAPARTHAQSARGWISLSREKNNPRMDRPRARSSARVNKSKGHYTAQRAQPRARGSAPRAHIPARVDQPPPPAAHTALRAWISPRAHSPAQCREIQLLCALCTSSGLLWTSRNSQRSAPYIPRWLRLRHANWKEAKLETVKRGIDGIASAFPVVFFHGGVACLLFIDSIIYNCAASPKVPRAAFVCGLSLGPGPPLIL